MLLALKAHPDNSSDVVEHIEVDVLRGAPNTLTLTWLLTGNARRIRLPAYQRRKREDELWKHTCFELFVGGEGESYYEFNFSPSGAWAAYRFAGHRSGMEDAFGAPVLAHRFHDHGGVLGMIASLDLADLPGLNLQAPLRLGLSAIIEDATGQRSFWALAHPPGEPDFHNPIAFSREIPTMDYS